MISKYLKVFHTRFAKSCKTSTFSSSLGELELPELPSLENFFLQLGQLHTSFPGYLENNPLLGKDILSAISQQSTLVHEYRSLFMNIASATAAPRFFFKIQCQSVLCRHIIHIYWQIMLQGSHSIHAMLILPGLICYRQDL